MTRLAVGVWRPPRDPARREENVADSLNDARGIGNIVGQLKRNRAGGGRELGRCTHRQTIQRCPGEAGERVDICERCRRQTEKRSGYHR